MFEGFESFNVTTDQDASISIHGLKSASTNASSTLPGLLLLHGFPQSRHMWRQVAPELTEKYNVVVIDLRGYGESSKPENLAAYAKSAMARDCVKVMESLGFPSFFVCAHDRGARVAHKLCVDHPDVVKKVILLDICPTLSMYTKTDFNFAKSYFHWFFLVQEEPLPESSILANASNFADAFLGGPRIFGQDSWDYYLKGLKDPATVHAMCHDYRAGASLDLEESRDDLARGRRLQCPLLIIWGNRGVIERCFDAVEEWRAVSAQPKLVEGYSVESGHFIPDEAPAEVEKAILRFLV